MIPESAVSTVQRAEDVHCAGPASWGSGKNEISAARLVEKCREVRGGRGIGFRGSTHTQGSGEHMGRIWPAGFAGVAALAVLAGCGASSTSSPGPTVTVTATVTTTASPNQPAASGEATPAFFKDGLPEGGPGLADGRPG